MSDVSQIALAAAEGERRWKELELLQKHYAQFEDFLYDVITDLLGFTCTWLQLDIGKYLSDGPQYRMIQAQRGQAKTTITACYAVWRLIHNPSTRILIVSAGSDMATEIANWVIQIIMNMPELECLRPDRSAGDRASVKSFDVHYALKGPEKSPSIACVGITSNLQGKRADVLIADDVESSKNSRTEIQREQLRHLTKDFTSICSNGDIIYLGTPQSVDSIYNGLPSRGFSVRIWTGRYPTKEELPNYNGFLAPALLERIQKDPSLQSGGGPTGDRGKATDPELLNEAALCKKEIDQGKAYFQLQHMLDTRLMDEDRYPLKSHLLRFYIAPQDRAPLSLNWSATDDHRIFTPQGFPIQERYYRVTSASQEFGAFQGTHMYVDPAGGGQNGDELAYAVTKFIAGHVYLVDVGGIPGGIEEKELTFLTEIAKKWKPNQIDIEENFGNGALRKVWTPLLLKEHKCGIEGVWESGQKELRIISVLEPVIGSGRLVVDEGLLKSDWERCQKYSAEKRGSYSFFFQLARITRDRGALMHDDRLDAVAGSVRHWVDRLAQDKEKAQAKARQDQYNNMIRDPLGTGREVPGLKATLGGSHSRAPNAFDKFKRR